MAQPSVPLLVNIDDTQTTLQVVGSTLFANGGVVLIESEKIKYTNATDTQLQGLTRGYLSTSNVAHLAGVLVEDLGELIPSQDEVQQVTTTERDELMNPAEGDIVMNTTTSKLNVYTGAAWEVVTSA